MIVLQQLVKKYGGRTVLDIPAFTFLPGETYALLGPNGAGKTTLLRILAGFLLPDSGSIRPGFCKDAIGYLPQTPYTFSGTVTKNMKLAARHDPAAIRRIPALLESVGLDALSHANAKTLSGGEAQRLALLRLLIREQSLLLLDEPTSATDIAGGDRIEEVLRMQRQLHGTQLIFATHAPGQALRLATQAIVLIDGKIAESGPVDDVLHTPRSKDVQNFFAHWRF